MATTPPDFGPLGGVTDDAPAAPRRGHRPKGQRDRSPRVKAETVVLATIEGIPAASAATGIPERTIARWKDDPQWQEMASRATEEIAEDAKVIAQLAMQQVKAKLPDASAWDASRVATQMTQIEALRLGKPTAITETKDTTTHDDDSVEALLAAAEAEQRQRATARAYAGDPPPASAPIH